MKKANILETGFVTPQKTHNSPDGTERYTSLPPFQQPKPYIEKPRSHNLRISIQKRNILLTVVLSNTCYITKTKRTDVFSYLCWLI